MSGARGWLAGMAVCEENCPVSGELRTSTCPVLPSLPHLPPPPRRRCYDRAVLRLRGEAAETNFPREEYAEVSIGLVGVSGSLR